MDITTLAYSTTTDFSSFLETFQCDAQWILIVGFIVAFFLAFGVGANDVANTLVFSSYTNTEYIFKLKQLIVSFSFSTKNLDLLNTCALSGFFKNILDFYPFCT